MKLQLINPVIAGSFEKTYEADVVEDAAKMFWDALAISGKYIVGNVPKFMFTMKEEGSGKLHHFVVTESVEGKNASYSIKKIDLNLSSAESKKLIDASSNAYNTALKIVNKHQEGGKRKNKYDDSSTSDSSDSDIDDLFRSIRIKSVSKPIVYWWYTPTIYKVEKIFTPTFVPSVTPLYTELWIPLP